MTRTAPRFGAGAAAFGWVLALYALPLVHNLNHRDDHAHGPTTAIEHSHPHELSHPQEHARKTPHGRVPLDSVR